jgi:hypothetical protein
MKENDVVQIRERGKEREEKREREREREREGSVREERFATLLAS